MKYFVSLFLTLLFPEILWAASVCGTATTSVTEADPQVISYTPDAGSNRVVVGLAALRGDATSFTAAPTFNAVTMTEAGTVVQTGGTDITLGMWGTAVTVGTAQDYSVDFTGTVAQSTTVIYTCTGADTTTIFRGAATTNAFLTTTSSSIDVPSAVNDLVLDAVATSGTGDEPTEDGSQASTFVTAQGANMFFEGSQEAGAAGNVTMSWTFASSGGAHLGASLLPAAVSVRRKPITFQ